MNKDYSAFISQLGPDIFVEISETVTKEFAQHNNLQDNGIPSNLFVTFSNYSSIRTSLILLEKYHDWLKL